MRFNLPPKSLFFSCLFWVLLIFIVVIHLSLLSPGFDAGFHMYGAFLITKNHSPLIDLWNNKPPLIYIIGVPGFILKSNPFLGVRLIELVVFCCDLWLLWRITKITNPDSPVFYLICFEAFYLVSWDYGFLTETFQIPLALLSLYLFLKKIKQYEFISSLLFALSFFLKQNSGVVIGGIILIDIFSNYRVSGNIAIKFTKYIGAIAVYFSVPFFILYILSLWNDFYDQVFYYNSHYVERLPITRVVINHFLHNSFISVKGISAIMLLNAGILFLAIKYFQAYRKKTNFSLHDKLLSCSVFVYLLSYPFVYISGKTHPHYFMLLIMPATLIFGYFVIHSIAGKIALLFLLAVGINQNIFTIQYENKRAKSFKEVAVFLKDHSGKDESIYVQSGSLYLYTMAERMGHTKFIIPLPESNGYTNEYKKIILSDFETKPPLFMVFSKNGRRNPDSANFYMQVVNEARKKYVPVFENDYYIVSKYSQ
jgi:hypothetical protein